MQTQAYKMQRYGPFTEYTKACFREQHVEHKIGDKMDSSFKQSIVL